MYNNYSNEFELLPELEAALFETGKYRYHDGELNAKYRYHEGELSNEFEIVGSQDTRKMVTDTNAAPFRYICQILTTDNNGVGWLGSGFFIGPRTILTAAHVIWDKSTNTKIPNSKIKIFPARNGAPNPSFPSPVVVNVIPSYSGYTKADNVTPKDYAIIHISSSLGTTTGYFGAGKWAKDSVGSSLLQNGVLPLPAAQMHVNVCGYPGDKGGDIQYTGYNMMFELQNNKRMLTYFTDTKGGQSGGPVWIKRDPSLGGRIIVGIHVGRGPFVTSPAGTVKYNQAVFLSKEVLQFIKANLK